MHARRKFDEAVKALPKAKQKDSRAVREDLPKVPQKSKTWEGFNYSLNQEKYLKVFLDDGEVPMDNNAAEQSIRGFCIGKKNWILNTCLPRYQNIWTYRPYLFG